MAKGNGIALLGGIVIGAAAILLMDKEKTDKIRDGLKSIFDSKVKPTVDKVKDHVEVHINGDK